MAASAAARTAALGSALSFINSRAAAEKHMATPDEIKQPEVTVKKGRKVVQQ